MVKARALWPGSFDDKHAKEMKARREGIVDRDNPRMVILEKAQEIREMNHMPGPVQVNTFEGEEVRRLERVCGVWVRYAIAR